MSAKVKTRLRVGIVGATGLAGQEFIRALDRHPLFEVTHLAASARSAGKTYRAALTTQSGALAWYAEGDLPTAAAALVVEQADSFDASRVDLVFSCMDAEPARQFEPIYAKTTPVISTASAYRRDSDVPILIPGVNMDQVALLPRQRERRGWRGFISPNPNCTTVGLAMTLAPLMDFGIKRVHMVSMQAVSGAGRSPGVIALDVVDNIIPLIPKEEDKVEWETRKILGTIDGDTIKLAEIPISCTCTRVGVLEGHTLVVHVELGTSVTEEQIKAVWRGYGGDFIAAGYPSAPAQLLHVHDDPFRPQVRLDRDRGNGLTTTVGRLRPDPHGGNAWKYVVVSHNTKMGAAAGCILLAEHLAEQGVLSSS